MIDAQMVALISMFTLGIVQLLKMSVDDTTVTIKSKKVDTIPVLALLVGVSLGLGLASGEGYLIGAITGLQAALVSMGVWSGTKGTFFPK